MLRGFFCETKIKTNNKGHSLQKKLFIEKKKNSADCVKIIELHVVHKWRHMQSE